MLKLELIALELLEYKVDDLRHKRRPKGGSSSAWELHNHLQREGHRLNQEQQKRYEKAAQDLKQHGELPNANRVVAKFDSLELDVSGATFDMDMDFGVVKEEAKAPPPEPVGQKEQAELDILKRLSERIWWEDMEDVIQRLAASCRAERQRQTGRLIYAIMRNLSDYAETDSFAKDEFLQQFKVSEAMPDRSHPLVSFNDIESLSNLIRSFIEMTLSFKDPASPYTALNIPEHMTLPYLKRFALTVAQDPYAGKVGMLSVKALSSKQIRTAIQELDREFLPDEVRNKQRAELEVKLKEALAHEKSSKKLFMQDVDMYRNSANSFFEQLEKYLPKRIGGSADNPEAGHSVLFGLYPPLRLETIPEDCTSLTVRVKGPVRFALAGLDFAIVGSDETRTLIIESDTYPILDNLDVDVAGRRVRVFKHENYLHFMLYEQQRSLANLIAEGLALQFITNSAQLEQLVKVLKIAAASSGNEVEELLRQTVQKLSALAGNSGQQVKAIERYIQSSARAARIELPPKLLEDLTNHLHAAVTVKSENIDQLLQSFPNAQIENYTLSDDPLNLQFEGNPLTIRKYHARAAHLPDHVVAMTPSINLGSFTDYLLAPFGYGSLFCALANQELTVIYFKPTPDIQPHNTIA